jgi:dTDP-4-amino-4,6-dideoxygalactose transaminase
MKDIFVTQPSLPPLDEFVNCLEEIWDSKVLTNYGKYHNNFEKALSEYLGVKHCTLFANGTLALIVGLQALRITGEVITTPYSFVATTHALNWNGITPVFCDIDEKTCNLDPEKIEALITPHTTAIMPVHVYGHPCEIDKISSIADTYGLKVIYDAAPAFGVEQNNNSILNFGDFSVLSFHATKTLTTFEGGALITNDEKLKDRLYYLQNFGFADEETVVGPGINAKMNELQAACGLLQLKHIDKEIKKRRLIALQYREKLINISGISFFEEDINTKYNYSYFPVRINKKEFGKSRDEVYASLKKNNIYARKYFYPLISEFETYKGVPSVSEDNLKVAKKVSKEILCLPIYGGLMKEDIEKIFKVIGV